MCRVVSCQMVEKISEKNDNTEIITARRVLTSWSSVPDLLQWSPWCLFFSIILSPSTVQTFCIYRQPTVNIVQVGAPIGAKTIVLEWVQVHRTGLVKLVDQDAKTKSTQMRELCSGIKKMKAKLSDAERTLLTDKVVLPNCLAVTTQASEWEKRQRLQEEEFVAIHVSPSC